MPIRQGDKMKLTSYVNGAWVEGDDEGEALIDPVTGEELARASTAGIDIGAAMAYGRDTGGPALRAMTYAERAKLLGAIAETLTANRDAYGEIALANSGNTKADAAIDIDGGIGTLQFLARQGERLGDAMSLRDGRLDRLSREETFQALHLSVPIRGIAVHINAFNFPSWGLWEKAAVALLAGVPVFAKPATATAMLSQRMVKDVIEAGILPDGALSLVCGSARAISDNVTGRDAIAFTGSAETANTLRTHGNVAASSVRLNIEADSLNASILGPDASPGSAEFDLYVREVAKEMTQKAGQKCTAIRRALVPAGVFGEVTEALEARLSGVKTGNPRNEDVTMGPLVNMGQQTAVLDALDKLKAEAKTVTGDGDFSPIDADPQTSCFVAPTLLSCADPKSAKAVHEVEAFGPVCTLMPYDGPKDAFQLAARGSGSLAASVFTADPDFAVDAVTGIGADHGRVLVVDESVGRGQTGHGIVMPQCVHGGPGRAGGGEELGGLRALRFYHQRLAVQGRVDWLERLAERA
ncbi:MAG TPA: 3,4-dehydroadipyl-CoA semialdehyde dehydrogenase, partial [Alphaproteobacteria bacterium]|nr:3,4-dehydroadipyl-CoA semialdehyde dehydrogenase [Alphaproteobacteria bacterium]